MSDNTKSPSFSSGTVKDIFLWRRKKLSVMVVSVATVIWVLLDVYEFNFITIASWLAIFLVSSLFIYANLVRLFRKEEPNVSNWEVSEETAIEISRSVREMIEEGIRWMFFVSAEKDWFTFVRAVAVLWLLSYVGSSCDFLTLLYIGTIGGMTGPVMYVKNEDRIKRCEEWMRMKTRRVYEMVDERVFKQVKNKLSHGKEKDKKVE
ncbi:reticulon-like protein B13 [Mercurialis annua]|uniref:reticulon-like protein B13 n=1 Tax=Mercurialis annua TaxID=3986 RepID=UPI0021604DDB|nr:reticulon-like protein B13 [Mercurialis annua]